MYVLYVCILIMYVLKYVDYVTIEQKLFVKRLPIHS